VSRAPLTPWRFVRDGWSDVRTVARGWRWGVGRRALVPRSAEPFVPARSTRVFPTRWARGPVVRAVREVALGVGMNALLRSQVSVHAHGLDVLDRIEGPVVFVANHSSHVDTPLILNTLPARWRRRTAVAAAADYFFDTWWRAAGSAVLFNTFPIERRGGALSNTPGYLIRDGWSIVVYPEGTRSRDGWTQPFKLGAAFMASSAGVPVVPLALRGTFNAMPHEQGWPSPGRPPVSIRYGEPVVPREGEGPRELAKRIEAAMAALVDEDAGDWFAARRRAADGATAPTSGPDVARWRRVWETSRAPQQRGRRTVWR
jgi:1-acyl-sn-glycerol-3-phosphate acyltransferase